jgi:hypothetical protein
MLRKLMLTRPMLTRLWVGGVLAAGLVMAQGRGGGGDMGGRGGMDNVPIMTSRPSRFDQMAQTLKLNKDQKKTLRSTMDEAQKEASPIREQMLKNQLAIGDAVRGGKGAEELGSLVGAEAALETRMAAVELKAFAKIYNSLDKDQQGLTRPVFGMMRGIFDGRNWNTEE